MRNLLTYLGKALLKLYSKIFFRLSVKGLPLPEGPKIVVANHPTGTDPFVLFSMFKSRVSILIINTAFKVYLFGRLLRYIGHVPVNPKRGRVAFNKALKLLKKNVTLIIFIEGNFSPQMGNLLKPKTGAVRLALETGVPIVPLGIAIRKRNIKNINSTISGERTFGKWYLNGPYAITVGEPIRLKGSVQNQELVRRLSERVMSKINALAIKSSRRIKG